MKINDLNSLRSLQEFAKIESIKIENQKTVKGGGLSSSPLGLNTINGFFDIFID